MSPVFQPGVAERLLPRFYVENFPTSWKFDLPINGVINESWAQGLLVGGMLIMILITLANMKNRLLHKLILIELILVIPHGTFCFMDFPGYGWYVSATAFLLYASWCLHNIIAWMKTKPFLTPLKSNIYLWSFLLVIPYWIVETIANFMFNNNINVELFMTTRIMELFFRDPWWVFTCCNFIYNIKKRYGFQLVPLVYNCPHIGIMILSMILSIIFSIVDLLSATVKFGAVKGINPYWKLSLVFKCFCDSIILDDFKSALDKVRAMNTALAEKSGTHHRVMREKAMHSRFTGVGSTGDGTMNSSGHNWPTERSKRSFEWLELNDADSRSSEHRDSPEALPVLPEEGDDKPAKPSRPIFSRNWKTGKVRAYHSQEG